MEPSGTGIDWTSCELVKRVPGKVSGRPVVRGTRVLADTIIQDSDFGSPVIEIQENYPDVPVETIQALLAFAESHRGLHVA